MSRKTSPLPGTGPRPSYPRDSDRNHRAFIIRSLDKCDQELAVLAKLNRTLHTARKNVVEQCGDGVLLDMGRGHLRLVEGKDALEGTLPPQEDMHAVCIDFLLRMKLRRRLLNRLARRLMRVSHAVDGEDVAPPVPPKYGDLRLHVDPDAVQEFGKRLAMQKEAKERIKTARQEEEQEKEERAKKMAPEETESRETGEKKEDVKEAANEPVADGVAKSDEGSVKDDTTNDKPQEPGAEDASPKKSSSSDEQEEKGTNGSKEGKPEEVISTPTKALKEELSNGTSTPPPVPSDDDAVDSPEKNLQDDFEILKEYKDTYEKVIDETTGEPKYTILDHEIEEDYETIKYGAGIGASHRSMSSKEKEADFKRWQHALLARIPDQPTFKDLGLEHRVFFLEERLKKLGKLPEGDDGDDDKDNDATPKKRNTKAKDDDGESPKKKKAKQSPTKKNENDKKASPKKESPKNKKDTTKDEPKEMGKEDETKDESTGGEEPMDIDQDKKVGEETDDTMESPSSEEDELDDDDEEYTEDEGAKKKDKGKKGSPKKTPDGKKKDEEKEKKEEGDDGSRKTFDESLIHERRKTMSMAAVPSFYEQDMRRIQLIHADLMATSIHEHAREKITEATDGYNAAFRRSNEIYNRRVKIQAELNGLLYEIRLKASKLKNDYALEVAIARSRWQKRFDAWNAQKIQTLMPAYSGRVAIGTPVTAAASARPDPITAQVGTTLSNVVDAVVVVSETGFKTGDFEPFVPPPAPSLSGFVDPQTGESLDDKRSRLENALRAELSALSAKLQSSEEDRKKAWKKMLKTRAEFELPSQSWTPGKRGRGQLDPNKMQLLPVPPLRASAPAVAPPAVGYTSSIPAYVPPSGNNRKPAVAQVPYTPGAGESKYSLQKVKERISADGTVAPVSEPKKNKDGLYQRPAGRTRKGMEWDAVRGIWVPA